MEFSQLDYAAVSEKADALKKASQDMEAIFNNLNNIFDTQIGENGNAWRGDAANNTKARYDEFRKKYIDFSNSVNECCDFLKNKVLTGYQQVDKNVTE